MGPGNTTDVTALMPQVERLSSRFGIGHFCIVADRGMICAGALQKLDEDQMPYCNGQQKTDTKLSSF